MPESGWASVEEQRWIGFIQFIEEWINHYKIWF
jgi:hypothetical protein